MKNIGRVLDSLDEILAPENKIHLAVKEVSRYYDPKTAEHTYTLEYRVKVAPANRPYRRSRAGSLLGAILDHGTLEPVDLSAPSGLSAPRNGVSELERM